jgi:hypothetical protein
MNKRIENGIELYEKPSLIEKSAGILITGLILFGLLTMATRIDITYVPFK